MAVLPQPNGMLKEEKAMTITRIDAEARWSDVVIHNQTLYYTGVPANLDADAFEQTANTLAQIDAVLENRAATSRVFLTPPSSSPIKATLRR